MIQLGRLTRTREPFRAVDLVDLSRLDDFQRAVMEAVAQIPSGQMHSYGEVAAKVGGSCTGRWQGGSVQPSTTRHSVPPRGECRSSRQMEIRWEIEAEVARIRGKRLLGHWFPGDA